LRERRLKVLHDLCSDDVGIGKVGAVFEAFVSEAGDVGIFIQFEGSSSRR
jgi:hypothetical protein